MRSARVAPILGLVLLLASSGLSAQTVTTSGHASHRPAAWAPSPEALARLTPAPADAPAFEASTPSALGAAAKIGRRGRQEAVALMVVGAAGIVTGLIADESILIIAGAGVGGFGLYLYLR
jgi:ferric-dicitrate binding protein FerR (iron transport regulator)